MRMQLFRNTLIVLVVILLFAAPCWAKSKGYCYIVSYSFMEKKAFLSPIIIQKVDSKSYSAEEFVTDVELIQKLELQFQTHISRLVNVDAGRYTVSARGAYKTNAIAAANYKDEREGYENKGFAVTIVRDFVFSD